MSASHRPADRQLHRRWKFVVFGSSPRPMNAPVSGWIALGRFDPRVGCIVERRGGDLEHEQLLRKRLFEFLRRDAEAIDGERVPRSRTPAETARSPGPSRSPSAWVAVESPARTCSWNLRDIVPRPEVRGEADDRDGCRHWIALVKRERRDFANARSTPRAAGEHSRRRSRSR